MQRNTSRTRLLAPTCADPHCRNHWLPGAAALWYTLAVSQPAALIDFIGQDPGRLALWLQLLMLEIGLDLIRMA